MNKCSLCWNECAEIKHLALFVIGSEGVDACLSCRIALTEVARSMMSAATRGRKQGYKAAKLVAEAKAERAKP